MFERLERVVDQSESGLRRSHFSQARLGAPLAKQLLGAIRAACTGERDRELQRTDGRLVAFREADALLQFRDRTVVSAERKEGGRQVAVRGEPLRIDLERAAMPLDCAIRLAVPQVRGTNLGGKKRRQWIQFPRAPHLADRFFGTVRDVPVERVCVVCFR